MYKFLDFGLSDPLTLGMANPQRGHLVDRLETLARKRPVTRLSRTLAASLLLGGAALSAPLTVADAHPEKDIETKSIMIFSDGAIWSDDGETKLRSGGSYEIVTEDGEISDYRISDGGKIRKRIDVELDEGGTYLLTLEDGEIITLDKPDLSGLESLKGLKALNGLEGLGGLSSLSDLSKLESLSALSDLNLQRLSDGDNVKIIINGETLHMSDDEEFQDSLREKIQGALKQKDGVKGLRVFRKEGGNSLERFVWRENSDLPEFLGDKLPDTFIRFGDESLHIERSLEHAERQLGHTEKQLERLTEEGDLSKEMKQALRDLAKAKKSLEKARLEFEDKD